MKKFFSAGADEIRSKMLPFYGKLSKEKQNLLFGTRTPEEFIHMLAGTVYGRRMELTDENMSSEQFEKELIKMRCTAAKRSLTFSDNAAVSIYSYMYLSEVEFSNIISIIESIRYNKSVSYMENLIVKL